MRSEVYKNTPPIDCQNFLGGGILRWNTPDLSFARYAPGPNDYDNGCCTEDPRSWALRGSSDSIFYKIKAFFGLCALESL